MPTGSVLADRRFAVMAVPRSIGYRRTDGTEAINWLRRLRAPTT
ncbi:hypothetical protein [Micromonospora qiuiae]|nr:hypothetical protein [Micromonospora qiuiae]